MMISWLKSFFSASASASPVVLARGAEATEAEVEFVATALMKLQEVGIELNPEFGSSMMDFASQIVAGYQRAGDVIEPRTNRITMRAPYPILMALWNGQSRFKNATLIGDHCYDGATSGDYVEVFNQILGLAREEWRVESIDASVFEVEGKAEISLRAIPAIEPFVVTAAKDFDCSAFARLNERASKSVENRFAYIGDGGTILVVWLPPENITRLSKLCGIEFQTAGSHSFQ